MNLDSKLAAEALRADSVTALTHAHMFNGCKPCDLADDLEAGRILLVPADLLREAAGKIGYLSHAGGNGWSCDFCFNIVKGDKSLPHMNTCLIERLRALLPEAKP